MRRVTNVIIKFIELIEAEGRSFRRSAIMAAENVIVIFFALFMMFAGVGAALFTVYLWLSVHVGRIGGSAILAVLLLAGGGGLFSAVHARGMRGERFFIRAADSKTPERAKENVDGK